VRRHGARLWRIARGILGDDCEAEDVVQDTYLRAYLSLSQFAGRSRLSTWLARIAIHEALARARRRRRFVVLDRADLPDEPAGAGLDPESALCARELGRRVQSALAALPRNQQRVIELGNSGRMTTADAARSLEVSEEAFKVRLHRARAALRRCIERCGNAPRSHRC
jgi:RNA polymerase sigma-70 factor (ECF subfamily)